MPNNVGASVQALAWLRAWRESPPQLRHLIGGCACAGAAEAAASAWFASLLCTYECLPPASREEVRMGWVAFHARIAASNFPCDTQERLRLACETDEDFTASYYELATMVGANLYRDLHPEGLTRECMEDDVVVPDLGLRWDDE